MHTVTLPLITTSYDCQIMEKRFYAISHVHNVLVKHARKLIRSLDYDNEYQALKAEYIALLKKGKLSGTDSERKRELSSQMNAVIRHKGLSKYGFESYIKVCGRQFRKCLSSQQIQKEAARVWEGAEKVLYGNGKEIRFKKYRDFNTICGKSNTNGAKFSKEGLFVDWMGLNIKCRLPKDDAYILEALDTDISYCEIKRRMFPNGWHYYVVIYLKGETPLKIKNAGDKDNVTGMDIGTSTMATVSASKATLAELSPRCKEYNRRIEKLLRHMDMSKRMMNPHKYNSDGTINRGNREKWVYSNTYIKNMNSLKSLYRQKAAYIKQSHEEMVNQLLTDSVTFVVEEMSFKGLQKKAKSTVREEKLSIVKQKDGSIRQIHKCKRKKRFGGSLNNRAPGTFLTILKRKAMLYGGNVYMVNTKSFKASQYDHVRDEYVKFPLKQRNKYIGGQLVQRDLYSAFLLRNTGKGLDKPDRDKCIYEFENFIRLQNNLLSEMRRNNMSMKQCFGF